MSTYSTAVVMDVPPDDASAAADSLARVAREHADSLPPEVTSVYVARSPDGGWTRLSVYLPFQVGLTEQVERLLAAAARGRAVIAEDNDEFGALWVVLAADDGAVRAVHRRYILNADPDDAADVELALSDFDPQGDPRVHDVAGPEAAAAAAALFDVDPGPVIDAELNSRSAWEELGSVGGPFPWWDAMGLTWPGPAAGVPHHPGA